MQLLKDKFGRLALPIAIGVGSFALSATGINIAHTEGVPTVASVGSSAPSTAPTSPVQQLPIGSVPVISSWADISLPVDRYREPQSTRNNVLTAEYQYTKDCAAKYGVVFDAAPPTRSASDPNTDYYRLFGLIDPVSARQNGYHTGEKLLSDGEVAPAVGSSVDTAESAPNYYQVVTGDPAGAVVNGIAVPAGGCIAAARAKFGDSAHERDLVEQGIAYGLSQSDRDVRVVKSFAAWSTCMKNAGYSYDTPTDANNDARWSSISVSSTEIATATADVRCKTQTGLTALRVAVASAWINKFITTNGSQFGAMKAHFSEQLQKATTALRE